MRKIYTAITMLLFSVSVFALETEFVSAASEQATPTDITEFIINDVLGTVDPDAKTVAIELPAGTDLTALVPTFSLSDGANAYVGQVSETTLQVSGETAQDFSSAVEYIIENDGAESVWTVSVSLANAIDETIFTDVKLYPNPATDRLVVENVEGATSYAIINVVGKVVRVESIDAATAVVDLSDLNKGIYIIQVSAGKDSYSARFIKE